MKYILSSLFFSFLVFGIPVHATEGLAQKLSGKILLQVESYGRAWYVNPTDQTRYYLRDGNEAYEIMRTLGLGITNADLEKIPTKNGEPANQKLINRLLGRIVLQVEERGEAWYINPDDGFRYYMKDGDAAYTMMRNFSLGISNVDLATIPMNGVQLAHDTTFDDIAYIKTRNGIELDGQYPDQILPPASMTKLMTALVLMDQPINWSSRVTLSDFEINYPLYYAGADATSEIALHSGDIVTMNDLLIAMLVASSNQSAIALTNNSGMSRNEFIQAMNSKAESLGLTKTVFYDVSGLNAHNVTTPREMAVIASAAFSHPDILTASSSNGHTIITKNAPSRSISVVDRNYTLRPYNPTAVKTGFLDEAQRCVSMKVGNDIIVVMHARSMSERNTILNSLTQ